MPVAVPQEFRTERLQGYPKRRIVQQMRKFCWRSGVATAGLFVNAHAFTLHHS